MNAQNALDYLLKQIVIEATCLDEEAFNALAVLTNCVTACEIVACNGQYNQYSLEKLKAIARSAYKGEI